MIVKDPAIMGGRPCFQGTRIPVDIIRACIANGLEEEAMKAYSLTPEQMQEAKNYRFEGKSHDAR